MNATAIFSGAGYYRLKPPSEPTVAWCQDADGWVDIFDSEQDAQAGRRPMLCCSPAWFEDIVAERIEEVRS